MSNELLTLLHQLKGTCTSLHTSTVTSTDYHSIPKSTTAQLPHSSLAMLSSECSTMMVNTACDRELSWLSLVAAVVRLTAPF